MIAISETETEAGLQCLPGTCTESQYGLKLASKAAVPDSVIQHAIMLANRMRKEEKLRLPRNKHAAQQTKLLEKLHALLIKTVQDSGGTSDSGGSTAAMWQEIVQCAKQGCH